MVSNASMIFMGISLFLSVGFPLALAIYYYKKRKYNVSALFIGVLSFVVFQIFTRIQMLAYLARQPWFVNTIGASALVSSLFAAFTAGLFEEGGRFILYKLMMKNKQTRENSIAFGIGHGGIEAILLLGFTMALNLYYSVTINSGYFDAVLAPNMPAMTAIGVKNALMNTASYMFLIGGIERALTIIVHIGFSIIVMYGVLSNRFKYVLYAILAHTLLDFPIGLLINHKYGILIIELYLAVFAILSLIFIAKSRRLFSSLKQEDVSNLY